MKIIALPFASKSHWRTAYSFPSGCRSIIIPTPCIANSFIKTVPNIYCSKMETRNIWNPERRVSFLSARFTALGETHVHYPAIPTSELTCQKGKPTKFHSYLTTCSTRSYACVFPVFVNQSVCCMNGQSNSLKMKKKKYIYIYKCNRKAKLWTNGENL